MAIHHPISGLPWSDTGQVLDRTGDPYNLTDTAITWTVRAATDPDDWPGTVLLTLTWEDGGASDGITVDDPSTGEIVVSLTAEQTALFSPGVPYWYDARVTPVIGDEEKVDGGTIVAERSPFDASAATYSGDLGSPVQIVRHLIGDTDPTQAQLTDAEIMYELGRAQDATGKAAIACCRALMARYAPLADTTELDLSVKASQLFDHYKELAEQLTTDGALTSMANAIPYAGGVDVLDVYIRNNDLTRTQSFFQRPFGRTYRRSRYDY